MPTTPCLYLHAPTDDIDPAWCGLGFGYPSQCRECEQYEATWNRPDEYEIAAWRLVNTGYAAASEQVTGTKPPPKSMGQT